jgi:quercetin dioxygenase-like cupin family protein
VEARVVHESEVLAPRLERSAASVRTLIGPEAGSRHVLQQVLTIPPGTACDVGAVWADQAVYVARGPGRLAHGFHGREQPLGPEVAFRVPRRCSASVSAGADVDVVLICANPPPPPGVTFAMPARDEPIELIREGDRQDIPAGDDRRFRLLVENQDLTQFVGFIDRSKAPPHTHTYEEAIYILEGEGIVHVGEGRQEPIRAGTSIFLPPGTPHCLENRSEGVLKLLGVFSPPGSPAARVESRA